MHETKHEPPTGSDAPPARRGRVLATALLVAALVAAGAWYKLRPAPPPEPPAVDLTTADFEVAQAVCDAQDAVRKTPRSARAWGRLGMVLAVQEFREAAVLALAEAERLDPAEPRWPYWVGAVLQRDDPETAVVKFQQAAERSHEPAVQLRLAEALLELSRFDEANALLQQAAQAEPGNARTEYDLGQLARARGDLRSAATHLQRAAESPGPRARAIHSLLTEVYRQTPGKSAEANREQETLAGLAGDAPWPDPYGEEAVALRVGRQARIERANNLRRTGQVREAETLMRETVALYPDSDQAWMALGAARMQSKDFAGAQRAFEEAVRHGPRRFEAQFRLGVALYSQREQSPEKLGKAVAAFRRAIQLAPTIYAAHFRLGLCLEDLGDRGEAIAAYRTTLLCRPEHTEAQRNLGRLLTEAAEEAAALAGLQRLCGCYVGMDVALALQAEALGCLRHAAQLAPQDKGTQEALERLRADFPLARGG
jgi:tetratricopeptide (TPR) repeat protein